MVGPLVLALVAVLSSSTALAQTTTERPTLQQVATVATARASFRTDPQRIFQGSLVSQDDTPPPSLVEIQTISQRFLTQDEVVALMLGDPDGDGVASVADASPLDPETATDAQVRERRAAGRGPSGPVARRAEAVEKVGQTFPGQEAMLEAFLEDNERQPLYSPDALIQAAQDGGIPTGICQRWRARFGKAKGVK